MIQQITHNIKVTVITAFEGTFFSHQKKQHAFSYQITIENLSQQSVQLISRYWLIKDALNETEVVEGEGVIGKQPHLGPGEKHSYNSGCVLVAPFGSMQGYYVMQTPVGQIKVTIPIFRLSAPFAMN